MRFLMQAAFLNIKQTEVSLNMLECLLFCTRTDRCLLNILSSLSLAGANHTGKKKQILFFFIIVVFFFICKAVFLFVAAGVLLVSIIRVSLLELA